MECFSIGIIRGSEIHDADFAAAGGGGYLTINDAPAIFVCWGLAVGR
jgi:hypothetical protein